MLKLVLVLNAIMFVVECTAGIMAGSSALLADSLDMFGDAVVYGFSLYALTRSIQWKARASFLKGVIMAMFGLGVLVQVVVRVLAGSVPVAETMGVIGCAALLVNGACLALLYKHRSDDINMKSTWLCSRNDIIANLGVLAAAFFVGRTQSLWPDVAVGGIIAALFLWSSFGVLAESWAFLSPAPGKRSV